ncbi:MAG TPA: T9SS type A sorting domain-containing protein [Flavipsychrobacter sp.]
MKLKSTFLFIASFLGLQASAQTWVADTVVMGGSYANDVFYSMKNGGQKTESNTNWHIAFMTTAPGPNGNVSVIANHVQGGVKVYSLNRSASADFTSYTSVAASDTATQLYNADTSLMWGAVNNNRVVSDPFDYGWGRYDIGSHNVIGDTLYLLKTPAGIYKLWIQNYRSAPSDSVQYMFRLAKLDNSEDTLIRIYRKPTYENKLFAYYDIANKTFRDREPNRNSWDIMFTRYITTIMMPSPTPYPVMGVMSNLGVTVAEVKAVHPDTVNYNNYAYGHYSNIIGDDWKSFNNTTFSWTIDTNATYFIRSSNTQEIYQLVFTGFGGSTSGTIEFKKRKVADVTTVNDVNSRISRYAVVPNPASANANIVLEAKGNVENAQLAVYDLAGRMLMSNKVNIKEGMNAYAIDVAAYAPGVYIVNISGEDVKLSERIVVQH